MKLTSSAKFSVIIINLLISSMMIKACKPGGTSDIQSIDNLGNNDPTKFTLNNCMPYAGEHTNDTIESKEIANKWAADSSRVEVKGTMPAGVQQDLAATMGLVPAYILKPLYEQSSIKIYIMDDATDACSAIAKVNGAEPVEKPFNCWAHTDQYNGFIFANGKISDARSVSVRESIRHSMIRSMAHYYFHGILDSGNVPEGLTSTIAKLKSSNESDLGKSMVNAFDADLKAKSSSLEQLKMGSDSLDLRKAIFVESIDSEFCSQATNDKFKSEYPKLYSVYKGKAL